MDSNHRLSSCKEAALAARRQDHIQRKSRDSNPQVAQTTNCFQDSLLIQPDDFRRLRGLESNRHTLHGKQEGCHYIMGAKQCEVSCQRTSEHRVGLEPTLPLYESGVLAARRPVLYFSVGPEGLEPSPAWVRTRDAAANTSVPICLSVGVEGIEPSAHDL